MCMYVYAKVDKSTLIYSWYNNVISLNIFPDSSIQPAELVEELCYVINVSRAIKKIVLRNASLRP